MRKDGILVMKFGIQCSIELYPALPRRIPGLFWGNIECRTRNFEGGSNRLPSSFEIPSIVILPSGYGLVRAFELE